MDPIMLRILTRRSDESGVKVEHVDAFFTVTRKDQENEITIRWDGDPITKLEHVGITVAPQPVIKVLDRIRFASEEGLDLPDWALGQKGTVTNIINDTGTNLYLIVLDNGNTILEEAYHFDVIGKGD